MSDNFLLEKLQKAWCVLQQYDKLTRHDGWYADLVENTKQEIQAVFGKDPIIETPEPKEGEIWYCKPLNKLSVERVYVRDVTTHTIAISQMGGISPSNATVRYKKSDVEMIERVKE